jgi:hypothetical protein
MNRSRQAIAAALTLVTVLATALATALPTPAQAATRPVTLTASSACVYGQWTVTVTVKSTRARVVDLYDSSDYGNRLIVDVAGVAQRGVKLVAGKVYRFVYRPGASAQYAEIGVFPVGSGGWDGWADPLAWKLVVDPIQTNPHATC